MKISNSKKQLAKIISENGSWPRNADWAAQCKSDSTVSFYYGTAPYIEKGDDAWYGDYLGAEHDIDVEKVLPNWHQTILSRDEYFHLYPAPDADGWVEWKGGECPIEDDGDTIEYKMKINDEIYKDRAFDLEWSHEGEDTDIIAYRLHKPEQVKSTAVGDDETNLAAKEELEAMEYKPSIEQLAAEYRNRQDYAERKQQEADAAKAEAEAKLAELVAAGKAVGLVLSVAASDPELVITDWRDLQVGDEVECLQINITGGDYADDRIGSTGIVVATEGPGKSGQAVKMRFDDGKSYWAVKWRFIRRPAKGDANA